MGGSSWDKETLWLTGSEILAGWNLARWIFLTCFFSGWFLVNLDLVLFELDLVCCILAGWVLSGCIPFYWLLAGSAWVSLEPWTRLSKCHIFYTNQKVRGFWQYQICESDKIQQNIIKIILVSL